MARCYRDRTWCSASSNCLTVDCSRKITSEVQQAAEKWWGGPDAPFSLTDFSKGCKDYVPATQD